LQTLPTEIVCWLQRPVAEGEMELKQAA